MTKLTVISYCHAAHQKWLPFWAKQLNQQTYRDFNIIFVAHNWKWDTTDKIVDWNLALDNLDDDLWDRVSSCTFESDPIIGYPIDFAASHVETEYLAHFDLDDLIHPKRFELQMNFLEQHPEIDFLNARSIGFRGEEPAWDDLYKIEDTSPLLRYLTSPQLNTNEQIRDCFAKGYNCLSHGLMIYRPEVLQHLGGFSKSDVKTDGLSPDWQTWRKAINAGYKFYRLPELLMYWRLDSSAIRL